MKCKALTVRGIPCQSTILRETGYCAVHDPDLKEVMDIGRRKGGGHNKKRTRTLPIGSLDKIRKPGDAKKALDEITRAVTEGRVGHLEAGAATSAINAWLRAYQASDMEKEVQQLKAALKELKAQKALRVS